mgnify:FL=1
MSKKSITQIRPLLESKDWLETKVGLIERVYFHTFTWLYEWKFTWLLELEYWYLYLQGAIGSLRVPHDWTVVKLAQDMVTLENRSGYVHSLTGLVTVPVVTAGQSMYSAQLSGTGTTAVGLAWQKSVASAVIQNISLKMYQNASQDNQ